MRIREYQKSDFPQILRLFQRQGYEYDFPPEEAFIEKEVLVDDNDQVRILVGAIPTADIYMVCDDQWETPGMRMAAIKLIHEEVEKKLKKRKIFQVHAWLPPQIERFGRRLMKDLSWTQPLWKVFARRIY